MPDDPTATAATVAAAHVEGVTTMIGPDAFHATLGSGWCREGTAHRSPVSAAAVRHLLVEGDLLWCSGGRGRRDSNPHSNRYCPKCVALAKEYVEEHLTDDE